MKKLTVVAIICLAFIVRVAAQEGSPDLILTNGKIFTSNVSQPYVQALAIRGERITAVGTTEEIRRLAGKTTRIVDLGGRTVIPGINDAHNHLFIAPQNRVDLHFKSPDPSWAEASQILTSTLEKAPKGAFIYGDIGPTIFHDVSVDRVALDKLSREHPVILTTFTGHGAIVNSAALAAANIAENQPDPLGGRYEHLSDGRLSGVLREYAVFGFNRKLADQVSDVAAAAQLRETLDEAARFGITTIQDMSDLMPPARCVVILEKIPTPIRVRIMRMPMTTPTGRDTREGWPAPAITNSLIKVNGTKWLLDGVPVEGTFTPRQSAAPAGELFMHLPLTFPKTEVTAILEESLREQDPLLLHVSGRPAPEAVLDAMKAAGGKSVWSEKRVRFEHGDGLTPDLLPAAKELGVVVVQNPAHLDGVDVLPGVGASLEAVKAQPLKSLLDAGIPLALSSDGPMNPYLNIMFASLHPDRPSEAITREQAVVAYTLTSAYAEFAEKEKGSLEPGKLADLAVLSQDIFTVPPSALPKTTSVLTLVGGKIVYDAKIIQAVKDKAEQDGRSPELRTGDTVAERIRVSFDPLPSEWVPEENVMDPIWEPIGYKGVNYYAYGGPVSAKKFAERSDPTSSLYQAWLGAYVIVGGKSALGSGEKGDQCAAFSKLAEYDQRSWLEAMGDPHALAESSTQRHFLTVPVEGSDRTACSFDLKTHSDLSSGDTPLAKHMGMPPATKWQDQLTAFHDVTLHVVGAWWYDPQRDLTMIVYTASSTFRNRAGMVKDNDPAIATSLRRIMRQTKMWDAGTSRQ